MSVLGVLARGAEGAMKGGDVLAKGEEEKREAIMWNARTEATRKNNMDRLAQQHENQKDITQLSSRLAEGRAVKAHERTTATGYVDKTNNPITEKELQGHQAELAKINKANMDAGRPAQSLDEYMSARSMTSSTKGQARASRELVKEEANVDFDTWLKSPDGKAQNLSKAQIPNIRTQWQQAYVSAIRGGKGSSLTANQFVTQFVEVRKEMMLNEFADPKEVKKLMKQGGASGSPSAWIDKKARESVISAAAASQAGRGLSPSQQTRMNVADERNLAEAATKFEMLTSAEQVMVKAEQEKRGKTRALQAIIDRAAQDKISSLPEAPVSALGQPTLPSVIPGETTIQRSQRLREESRKRRVSVLDTEDIGGA